MPSIQQIIAEIQLAPDLPPHHITKVVNIIKEAEQRLKLKTKPTRPKLTSKNLMSLPEWELTNGTLNAGMMPDWMLAKRLCYRIVADMIAEFRSEMLAKDKQYASFKLAFQTYMTKGYLSKKIDSCTLERSPYKITTTIENRGVTL